jgi:hypothetical protein
MHYLLSSLRRGKPASSGLSRRDREGSRPHCPPFHVSDSVSAYPDRTEFRNRLWERREGSQRTLLNIAPMLRNSFILLMLILLATGCGTDKPRTGATVSPTPTPTTASPARTTALPTRTTASPSPARRSTFPHAADGSKIGACADGRCEVLVTHPVRVPLHCRHCGVTFFAVVRIRPSGVYFHVVGSGGSGITVQQPPGADPSSINHLAWTVVAVKGHRAVIKLSHV